MARYVSLIQFTDQGIRDIRDTIKRGDAAMAEAEKMGMKIIEEFWTMGAHDVIVVVDAPNDETVSAFVLKTGSLGNVKSHTMRAFRRAAMEGHFGKDQITPCFIERFGTHVIRKRFISCSRASMASRGLRRLSTFSRRSGSIAASSRTSLSRVLHFA
jgi:uncharacterized protein with GYD domain